MNENDNPRSGWEKLDTSHRSNAICPYCGYEDKDSWELFIGDYVKGFIEHSCCKCEKEYNVESIVDISYTTYRKGEI